MSSFRNVEDYAREHEEASRNIQQYLSNPINAYLLVKRLTTDWKKVEELITEDVGKSFVANITNSRSDLKFPTDEDLNGAAVALMRLQDTYKLETAQVARGVLNGVQYSTGLTGMYISYYTVLYDTRLLLQTSISNIIEFMSGGHSPCWPGARRVPIPTAFSSLQRLSVRFILVSVTSINQITILGYSSRRQFHTGQLARMFPVTQIRCAHFSP